MPATVEKVTDTLETKFEPSNATARKTPSSLKRVVDAASNADVMSLRAPSSMRSVHGCCSACRSWSSASCGVSVTMWPSSSNTPLAAQNRMRFFNLDVRCGVSFK